MDMPKKQLVAEALIDLHRRLSTLATRSHERRKIMQETANLYGVSEQSLYRALAQRARPRALRRSDRGTPRILPQDKMEYYCELIAALKVRTSNKKGRHLSTAEAIRLIEEFGVETPEGLIKAQKSMFKITTVNRYLRQWGYDHETLRRQPAAVRFQAEHSNDCWQFDLSPSDLKEIKEPVWLQPNKAAPTLMLFSVVDDRSGVAYQEYRCVYGEDVEAALRFLFNAMAQSVAPKTKIESVITEDAVAMLGEKLSTPLQFEYYLTRALEEAYKVGQKPVGADMIENVLAKDINALEPRLTRQGYNAKVLAELLNAKPREIKSFLSGQLAPGRTQELQSELLAAGIPL